MLMVGCLGPRNIRIGRVSSGIKRPNSIAIERVAGKSSIREAGNVRADLRDLPKVCAVSAGAAFDKETILVI